MPDEEMIERCAKAICLKYWTDESRFKIYIPAAKAAIKALREPTEKMIKAADVGVQSDFYPPDMTWQIMIDEILK